MKFIQSTAIVAVLLFILSCNQSADKSPQLENVASQLPQADKINKADDVGNELEKSTGSDNLAGNGTADFKQETDPPRGKDDHKQKQEPKTTPVPKVDWDKKIIKTASINLEIKDYNNYYGSLREKIKSVGGYVAQEEQTQSEYKVENVMVIKVPVDQFDNAVVLFSANAQKVNERKINSQDVTLEAVDTRSRMEAKKQVRQRYIDLMNQAKNMEEILNVQTSINGVQEEIESAAGRLQYLDHSSAFSTINLTYYQVLDVAAAKPEVTPTPGFGEKAKAAFQAGWDIVASLFLVFVTIWPLLLASFFAFVLYKKFRKPKIVRTEKLPGA